jgi:hypothetical protein
MVLVKNGEEKLEQSRDKYPANSKGRKIHCAGHILLRNCLLKHVTEEKVEGRIDEKTRKKT